MTITRDSGCVNSCYKRWWRAVIRWRKTCAASLTGKHPELKRDMALLTGIATDGERVDNNLLAVMHAHHFESAEQVTVYMGLVPV